MSEKTLAKRHMYPVFGILLSMIIFIFGLFMAKSINTFYFLGGVFVLLFLFGYRKALIMVLPIAIVLSALFGGITYAFSGRVDKTLAAIIRVSTVCLAVVPGLGIKPVEITRNLAQLKVSRSITLGMMITLSFFPLLSTEIKRIKEAMKTRGAGSYLKPKIFYRAFLVPLIVRLVDISDTLSLSIETRGFTMDGSPFTVYKKIKPTAIDFVLIFAVVFCAVLTAVL